MILLLTAYRRLSRSAVSQLVHGREPGSKRMQAAEGHQCAAGGQKLSQTENPRCRQLPSPH